MSVLITTALIGANEPQSVMIVVAGTLAGQNVSCSGTTETGYVWDVGVSVTSTGDQIVFVDTRAPIRQALVYQVLVDNAASPAPAITVPCSKDFALQAIDGSNPVLPFALLDGDFSVEPVTRATLFDVPGRRRPVVRYQVQGEGGSSFSLLTDEAQSRDLLDLLAPGEPIVYRSAHIRDLVPSDVIHVTSVKSTSNQDDNSRVWELEYILVDHPESTVALRTWAMFDAAYAASTWNAFDTEWLGSTWNVFDVEDWSQR